MTDSQSNQAKLSALLGDLLDGSSTGQQRVELEKLVLSDPSLKRAYAQLLSTHAMLHWMHGSVPMRAIAGLPDENHPATPVAPLEISQEANARESREAGHHSIPPSAPPVSGFGFSAFQMPMIFGFIVLFAIGSFFVYRGTHGEVGGPKSIPGNLVASIDSKSPIQQSSSKGSQPVAKVSAIADCKWRSGQPALDSGSALAVGQALELTSGVAEITYDVGARVIVQSPAAFSIDSSKGIRLDHGKLTAEITNVAAHGFKVITPDATFVDQGTEFGVEVAPGGSSRVHVFRGEVDLALSNKAGSALPTQRLLANAGARLEGDAPNVTFVEETGESYLRSMDQTERDLHVMAYWRFEDHPVGTLLPDTHGNKSITCATVDSSFNGNDLFTYSTLTRPVFSNDVAAAVIPENGRSNQSCLDNTEYPGPAPTRDVYTHSSFSHASPIDLQRVTPTQWTVEASIKMVELGRVQTFVGRDGAEAFVNTPPRLAFQVMADGHLALRYRDVDDRAHKAVAGNFVIAPGRWYHVAGVSDGQQLRLYANALDGRGYQLVAQMDLPADGSTALGTGGAEAEWAVGRGMAHNNWPGEWFKGWIDEVRICDIALQPSEFLFAEKDKKESN